MKNIYIYQCELSYLASELGNKKNLYIVVYTSVSADLYSATSTSAHLLFPHPPRWLKVTGICQYLWAISLPFLSCLWNAMSGWIIELTFDCHREEKTGRSKIQ